MDEKKLLSHLQRLEGNSAQYVLGSVRDARNEAMREYFRRPYGNEEEGWSQIVTSDVQDTVEWMLPFLLDMFVSSDDAVVFDPTKAEDVAGAEQATDGCNYVFYKQNNGVLVLYTAFKDALQAKNCAVHWRIETVQSKEVIPVRGVDDLTLAALLKEYTQGEGKEAEEPEIEGKESYEEPTVEPMIDETTGMPVIDAATGQPLLKQGTRTLYNARLTRIVERKVVRVEAFEPENLLIHRTWTTPLLADCPYVCRIMPVTLSDLKQMGFDDVEASDLSASAMPNGGSDVTHRDRTGSTGEGLEADRDDGAGNDDESLTEGFLRMEWVLVDYDGDGIAERRCVYRLAAKVLENEECSHVPIATGSPVLVQHRWLGMSMAEMVSDIMRMRTDLIRGVMNNAHLSVNPRKTVLVDSNGSPQADIDDLLDFRPGGVVRVKQAGALQADVTPFVGNQIMPLLEYVDGMKEQRTGVTKQRMGIDPNSLQRDRTLGETQIIDNASQARIKLVGRLFAETIVKPVMQGIFKLLTEGEMEPLAFKLRGEFVQYDPNEWRDGYDMTINVGTGTGDRQSQAGILAGITQDQMALAATPLGHMMVTPQQLYRTRAKRLELAGIKDTANYYTDPKQAQMPKPPPQPPPPQVMVKQMELQAEAQQMPMKQQFEMFRLQKEHEREQQRLQSQDEVQRRNDERDALSREGQAVRDHEYRMAQLGETARKTDADNATRVQVALISHAPDNGVEADPDTGQVRAKTDPMAPVLDGLATLTQIVTAPKVIVRDANGRPLYVQAGDMTQQITRDETGRISGLTPPIQ